MKLNKFSHLFCNELLKTFLDHTVMTKFYISFISSCICLHIDIAGFHQFPEHFYQHFKIFEKILYINSITIETIDTISILQMLLNGYNNCNVYFTISIQYSQPVESYFSMELYIVPKTSHKNILPVCSTPRLVARFIFQQRRRQ